MGGSGGSFVSAKENFHPSRTCMEETKSGDVGMGYTVYGTAGEVVWALEAGEGCGGGVA